MRRNLPHDDGIRHDVPWKQPSLEERLPLYCHIDDCGFKAETVETLAEHEHAESEFRTYPPGHEPAPVCALCNPPDDIHQRVELDMRLPFCDNHDESDLRAKERADSAYREQQQLEDDNNGDEDNQ